MAAEVSFDVLEQILVRLDVKDLIRCKSVCKSWQSFISSLYFVKAHLNHAFNNDAHRRRIGCGDFIASTDAGFCCNFMHIVGSCNGLVCVSNQDVELVVTNPWTRETNKLPTPFYQPGEIIVFIRQLVCCVGFGYDSSTDDYKVIVGFKNTVREERTLFHVLALKSNTWKVIGEVKYGCSTNKSGFFCGGALYWFMHGAGEKKGIMSLDLSTEECKEVPQPVEAEHECKNLYDHRLGVIEGCLCIYSYHSPSPLCSKIWIMRNNKWELYNYDYILDDGRLVQSAGDHIRVSMFVKSLVSPHPHGQTKGQVNDVSGNIIRKMTRKRKRSYKH